MKRTLTLLSLLTSSVISTAFAADIPFNVTNIVSAEGTLVVALHPSDDNWPRLPDNAIVVKLTPKKGTVAGVFTNVPDGKYAMSVLQDLNNNGTLEKNIIGIPKEPVGVSGDHISTFSAPDYDEATFKVKGNHPLVSMTLLQP